MKATVGLVRRVIVTTYISWRRRRWWRNELAVAEIPDQQQRADLQADAANRLLARKLLATLPTRQRTVLVLRFFDDLTETEVAAMMGCAVGTVKSQTAKALATSSRSGSCPAPSLGMVSGTVEERLGRSRRFAGR